MTTAGEHRAMSDRCFQLAQHALTKQERIRHCRMALRAGGSVSLPSQRIVTGFVEALGPCCEAHPD